MQVGNRRGTPELRGRHRDRFIERISRVPSEPRCDLGLFASGGDYPADMLARGLAPIPHVEWMHPEIGVAVAIHMCIGRVMRELALEVLFQLDGIGRLGE